MSILEQRLAELKKSQHANHLVNGNGNTKGLKAQHQNGEAVGNRFEFDSIVDSNSEDESDYSNRFSSAVYPKNPELAASLSRLALLDKTQNEINQIVSATERINYQSKFIVSLTNPFFHVVDFG